MISTPEYCGTQLPWEILTKSLVICPKYKRIVKKNIANLPGYSNFINWLAGSSSVYNKKNKKINITFGYFDAKH